MIIGTAVGWAVGECDGLLVAGEGCGPDPARPAWPGNPCHATPPFDTQHAEDMSDSEQHAEGRVAHDTADKTVNDSANRLTQRTHAMRRACVHSKHGTQGQGQGHTGMTMATAAHGHGHGNGHGHGDGRGEDAWGPVAPGRPARPLTPGAPLVPGAPFMPGVPALPGMPFLPGSPGGPGGSRSWLTCAGVRVCPCVRASARAHTHMCMRESAAASAVPARLSGA